MQKMKKLLTFVIVGLLLVSTMALVACTNETDNNTTNNTPTNEHVHQYSETVVPSTCTTKGYTMHKCECGDFYKSDEKELTSHQGKNQCSICGLDFGEKFKEIIITYGNNYEFVNNASNYTQKTYTNNTYEIVMALTYAESYFPYTVYLSYSSFDEKWLWLFEYEDDVAYGEFTSLSSASTTLPITYSDFSKSMASLVFSSISPMVYNANNILNLYNAGFTMENLGLKF